MLFNLKPNLFRAIQCLTVIWVSFCWHEVPVHADVATGMEFALDLGQVQMEPFYEGYFGKVGLVKLFVSPQETTNSPTKIYWAMVHILSKKYGCFMKRKMASRLYTGFKCSDGRVIVFRKSNVDGQVLISGRQFDEQGHEIVIEQRKIIARFPLSNHGWLNKPNQVTSTIPK